MAFHYSMLFLSHKMLAEKKVVGRRKGREGGKKRQEVGAWGGVALAWLAVPSAARCRVTTQHLSSCVLSGCVTATLQSR